MRLIFLIIIKSYWILIPPKKRKKCLFKESCSNYVYRITKEQGFLKGFTVLVIRIKQCRNGYQIFFNDNQIVMKLSDGTLIKEDEISNSILDSINISLSNFTNKFK